MREKTERPIDFLDQSVAADEERALARRDFRFFLKKIFYAQSSQYATSLGKVHDLLADFLLLGDPDEDKLARSSSLFDLIPAAGEHNERPERWLYYESLGSEPKVQDGPAGPISELFYGKFWRGLFVRVVGDGRDKCILLPRGHIKSTVVIEAHTCWEIVRNPGMRHLIISQGHALAKSRIMAIKRQFEGNPQMMRLFGDLAPRSRNQMWSSTALQMTTTERRGSDPTVASYGERKEITGRHVDRAKADDFVSEQNSKTPELRETAQAKMDNLNMVRDPGSMLTVVGTRWHGDDAYGSYLDKDGPSHDATSFMVGTLLGVDGQPLWPEKFTKRDIVNLDKKYANNRYLWFCQYFNQALSDETRMFRQDWISYFDENPVELALRRKLNIGVSCDPASSQHKKSDFSACIVQGEDPDTGCRYVLDGFRERLSPEQLPGTLCELIIKWQGIARKGGMPFRFGIEHFGFGTYIKPALRNELEKRNASCHIEEFHIEYRSKVDRISVLCHPYSMGMVFWPHSLRKNKVANPGETYDFVALLRDEFLNITRTGRLLHEDILDAQAQGEAFMSPVTGALDREPEDEEPPPRGYRRGGTERGMFGHQAAENEVGEDTRPLFGGLRGTGLYPKAAGRGRRRAANDPCSLLPVRR